MFCLCSPFISLLNLFKQKQETRSTPALKLNFYLSFWWIWCRPIGPSKKVLRSARMGFKCSVKTVRQVALWVAGHFVMKQYVIASRSCRSGIRSMFHRVYISPRVFSIMSMFKHWQDSSMFHCVFSPPCRCFTVSYSRVRIRVSVRVRHSGIGLG